MTKHLKANALAVAGGFLLAGCAGPIFGDRVAYGPGGSGDEMTYEERIQYDRATHHRAPPGIGGDPGPGPHGPGGPAASGAGGGGPGVR